MAKRILVTGASGFIGSGLTRRLVRDGYSVRALDNNWRGNLRRLEAVRDDIEFVEADIRDADAVARALDGMDAVWHLAYVNGTELFYSMPEQVLDVGVRGMLAVLDGCRRHGVGELMLASSSEVYQTPPTVPTDETAPLSVPDPLNPRYSYGGGKIISELMAINYGRKELERVMVFRPHNVYGPDMGWEHVLPQFALRMKALVAERDDDPLPFPIQGTGAETRAFNYIDDFVEGIMAMERHGRHLAIYHVGTMEEVAIADAARLMGRHFGREIEIVAGDKQAGGTDRRCPDISRLAELGYRPAVPLAEGIVKLAQWYDANAHLAAESGTRKGLGVFDATQSETDMQA
jgi:nucleoside-diphosphate-sugar epimerase